MKHVTADDYQAALPGDISSKQSLPAKTLAFYIVKFDNMLL
jgi:hypothetical protein